MENVGVASKEHNPLSRELGSGLPALETLKLKAQGPVEDVRSCRFRAAVSAFVLS